MSKRAKSSPPKRSSSGNERAKSPSKSPTAKSPRPKRTFYVISIDENLRILASQRATKPAGAFEEFNDVKAAAVDELLAAIEQLEQRLDETKRAQSFEDYERLLSQQWQA